MTANDPCNGGYMNETLLTSPAFRKQTPSRLLSAALVESEMLSDTGLTLAELHDRIDRAMERNNARILQHPAVKQGMETYNGQGNQGEK